MKKQSGITLVALVVTIVVLFILAGITLTYVLGDNSIIQKVFDARTRTEIERLRERIEIIQSDWWIDKKVDPTIKLDDFWKRLIADNIIERKEDIDGPEKEGNNDIYWLDTTEGYMVEVIITPDGNVIIGEIVKGDKIPPKVIEGVISQKGETVWNNHKASVELETTNTSLTLKYQINGISGTWLNYEGSIEELSHEDIICAVLTDGINYGDVATIKVKDETEPTNATITLGATNANTGANVEAKVTHNDAESGVKIGSCKWIYNTNSEKIGTAASSYTETFSSNGQTINLSASTPGTYYLHVLTVDNANNVWETVSSAIIVKALPPTVDGTSTGTHTQATLDYSWEKINKIAIAIANSSSVTASTTEVTGTVDGEAFKIGIGDYVSVMWNGTSKRTRVLGFKHDDLVKTGVATYGAGAKSNKASISFEFYDCLEIQKMDDPGGSSLDKEKGGWGVAPLRYTLQGADMLGQLSNKTWVKQVVKLYMEGYDNGWKVRSNDYLWLLSAGEVFNDGTQGDGTRGEAYSSEGVQYLYYKKNAAVTCDSPCPARVKYISGRACVWRLRSRSCLISHNYCEVDQSRCKYG